MADPKQGTDRALATNLFADAYFPPLPGTAGEGSALLKILTDARLLTGPEATKATLKSVDGPTILHIATHGFFLEDKDQAKENAQATMLTGDGAARLLQHGPMQNGALPVRVENPLLRSGLALAGANKPGVAN